MLVKVVRKTQLACSVWSGVRPAAISSPSFLISPALAKCKEKPVEGAGVTGTSRSLVLRWNSVSSIVARPLASVASKPASISRVRSGWMFASPAPLFVTVQRDGALVRVLLERRHDRALIDVLLTGQ